MGVPTIGQIITAFITANGITILIHLVIMVRTGQRNVDRIENLECDMKAYKTHTDNLRVQMAALTGRAEGIKYRRGD